MMGGGILVVPAFETGRGGGHLARSASLVRDLRNLDREAWLFLPAGASAVPVKVPSAQVPLPLDLDLSQIISDYNKAAEVNWDLIILDRFKTPKDEFSRWAALGPVIGIDEGGDCRDCFDFLIDILPALRTGSKPNISDPSLLPLPGRESTAAVQRAAKQPDGPLKVLISFGQEDAAGLGLASARVLSGANSSGELDIVLLHGPLHGDKRPAFTASEPSCRVLEKIPNLGEHLAEYDLLITHYGITAFEALYAGTPVLLVSPGAYHEKLANNAGFFSAGIGAKGAAGIEKVLFTKSVAQNIVTRNEAVQGSVTRNSAPSLNQEFLQKLKTRCAGIRNRYKLDQKPEQTLAALINSFTLIPNRSCPSCDAGGPPHKPLARFPHRTYYRCPHCGLIYMKRYTPPPIEYKREYFFDFYKKQYGKTYIEDFPNLMAMGKQRLRIIKPLLPGGNTKKDANAKSSASPGGAARLLDIGCAYGPFLAAAKEEGFNPLGIDPAKDAVRYINEELKLEARQGFFPGAPLPELLQDKSFDSVTLWYVIEHFSECPSVFHEIRRILKPGGVLAFSTPSFSGISGRKSLKTFLEQSPQDHWTIWSPAVCKRRLKAAGFKVKRIIISGHHPERFPLIGKYIKTKKGPLYALLMLISKLFGLGDTFEAYAIALPWRNGEEGGKK